MYSGGQSPPESLTAQPVEGKAAVVAEALPDAGGASSLATSSPRSGARRWRTPERPRRWCAMARAGENKEERTAEHV